MPLINIRLRKGKTAAYRAALVDGVQRALVETFAIRADDRFAFVDQYDDSNMVFPATFLGRRYSSDLVAIAILASPGRLPVQKAALYAAVARNLEADPGLSPTDVLVSLQETAPDNWSFGDGQPLYPSS